MCIVHGYLLEGSGSNLWTRSVVESLAREGVDVHLMAQENHPEIYPFISRAIRYEQGGERETFFERDGQSEAEVVLHKPVLGPLLPVYVEDRYEEYERVVPMVELDTAEIERYIEKNVSVLMRIVEEQQIEAIHVNHAVLMSVVAQRVEEATGVPFSIMPHGSALEYAVKKDERFLRYAEDAFDASSRIFVIGEEMKQRVLDTLGSVPNLEEKTVALHLGVNTEQFEPVSREMRPAAIEEMETLLEGVSRGKSRGATDILVERLEASPTLETLAAAARETSGYSLKSPDEEIEAKLDTIDWSHSPTILFVGRLIAAKGPQNVIAAFPTLLEEMPDATLVVVGHGPLREPLEALVWALSNGRRELVEQMVAGSAGLDEENEGFSEIASWLRDLETRGELDRYFELAERVMSPERVVFAGYLTHRELSRLFPCFDVAVFPSLVKEAGPLVFLEALASGVYPMGTYFGGMKASIDAVERKLSAEAAAPMKIDPDPDRVVASIASGLPSAIEMGVRHRDALRDLAIERYDWSSVSGTLLDTMNEMAMEVRNG